VFEAPITHLGIVAGAREYVPQLLDALESVGADKAVAAA
jgi:hypothetical protein